MNESRGAAYMVVVGSVGNRKNNNYNLGV